VIGHRIWRDLEERRERGEKWRRCRQGLTHRTAHLVRVRVRLGVRVGVRVGVGVRVRVRVRARARARARVSS
jgi:hypothetical protein